MIASLSEAGGSRPRSEVIDGFRGLAILAVLAFHYLFRWAPPRSEVDVYGYGERYLWPSFGWGGVQLFFIISGLVITMTLLRASGPLEFAAKRIGRIYPAFLVAATAIAALLLLHDPVGWKVGLKDFLLTLTLLPQNLGHWTLVDGAFWSLTVEVRFYFYAVLFYALLRGRFWWGLVGLGLIGNLVWFFQPQVANGLFLARSLAPFLLGIAIWFGVFERRLGPALTCAVAGLAFYGVHAPELSHRFGSSLLAHGFILGGGALMALLLWRAPNLPMGPLAWLGRISYSLYLYHQKLGVTLIHDLRGLGAPDLLAAGVATGVVIALAWVSFEFVEGPGQRLVTRLYRRISEQWRTPAATR